VARSEIYEWPVLSNKRNQGTPQKWRPAMAIFEGPEKNRNIIIVIGVLVVIAVIIYFYGGRI
jgi:hypothetical protein